MRAGRVQEIISRKPTFFEKWALLIFLMILLLLVAGAWFIEYPDIVEAKAYLTANNAPKEIMPRQDGRLVRIFRRNDDWVKAGDMIAWIESTAHHAEVISLAHQLDSCTKLLATGKLETVGNIFKQRFENLGELQISYQQFITAWQQFNDYLVNGFYAHKKNLLQHDISALASAHRAILDQKDLTEQDIKIAEESFKMNSKLHDDRVLSHEEYRVAKSKFVNKQLEIPQLDASIFSNENQQRDKQKEIDQLEHDIFQQKTTFQQALQTLKSSTDEWLRKYVLVSPTDGKIAFTLPVQENQFIQGSKLLGYVNPTGTVFYAIANVPQANSGKVVTGLDVQLRFDAYPYQEMGFVRGKLEYLSKVATDSGFVAMIDLDKGLTTSHHILVPYKSGLKASAIIVTKNMRLLQRLYFNIVKSLSTKKGDT